MPATDPTEQPRDAVNDTVHVTVVHVPVSQPSWTRALSMASGSTVQSAIEASGLLASFPDLDWRQQGVGLFGQLCDPKTVLRDGDRVEIYRALVFDPKESRRRRAEHRRQLSSRTKPRGARHG